MFLTFKKSFFLLKKIFLNYLNKKKRFSQKKKVFYFLEYAYVKKKKIHAFLPTLDNDQ